MNLVNLKGFKVNTDENFEQVEKYVGITIPEDQFRSIRKWTDDFYSVNRDLFLDRIKGGKIRDCHGDLHMEHICLTEDLRFLTALNLTTGFATVIRLQMSPSF